MSGRPSSPSELPQKLLGRFEPPKTMNDLVQLLELTLNAEQMKAGRCGRIVASFEGAVTRLEATYEFHMLTEQKGAETWDAMSPRRVQDWVATLAVPPPVLDAAFEKEHGPPETLPAHRAYRSFYVGGAPNEASCTLAWYEKRPDWAVPVPTLAIRERGLRALAKAATDDELTNAALLEGAGIVKVRSGPRSLELELVPPMLAIDLVGILGWGDCVGQTRDMHLQNWSVRRVTGENSAGAATEDPMLGRWAVEARFDGAPSGARVRAGGLGTYAIGPSDRIRFLHFAAR